MYLIITSASKTKQNSIWNFVWSSVLSATSKGFKWAVTWPSFFATKFVSFATHFYTR